MPGTTAERTVSVNLWGLGSPLQFPAANLLVSSRSPWRGTKRNTSLVSCSSYGPEIRVRVLLSVRFIVEKLGCSPFSRVSVVSRSFRSFPPETHKIRSGLICAPF